MDYFELLGRKEKLFDTDLSCHREILLDVVRNSTFLVVGGAGTIGQAVCLEIFKRNPLKLHVVDLSENSMVELVREIRSTMGYIEGEFKTFVIDCSSIEFDALVKFEGPYDFILNLSALKHPRSESDPFTLMRMVSVNIFNSLKLARIAKEHDCKKYFCVSTDKAANPVNMMGASKRIMEKFLIRESTAVPISMARFANVAFSDGSLLDGFHRRFNKRQPFSAPSDIRRYFITPQESGELCLLSGILGDSREIFFPKPSKELQLTCFSDIAERYLLKMGFEPYLCDSEDEARKEIEALIKNKKWPCYFFKSDTTGEKPFEEFYTEQEMPIFDRFAEVGVLEILPPPNNDNLDNFLQEIEKLRATGDWNRVDIINLFNDCLPGFNHMEKGKFLNDRM